MKMRGIFVCLGLVLVADLVSGFSRGAPACVKKPGHKAEPQNSTSPYQIYLSKKMERNVFSGTWLLTVGSDEEYAPEYKGILITAQQSGDLIPVDYEKFKTVSRSCDGLPAWTHSASWSGEENLEKKKSEWEFTPAEGATEEPSFRIHIVQDYRTFWVDILVTPSTHQGEDVERFAPVTEGSEVYDFSGERELSGEPGLNGDPELNGEFSGDGEQLEVAN